MADTATQQSIDTIKADNETLSRLALAQDNDELGADVLAGKKAPASSSSSSGSQPAELAHPAEEKAEAKAYEAKKAAAAKSTAEKAAQKAQVEAVAQSPWSQLGNALAQQYQAAEAPTASLISGAQTVPGQATASQTALALLGEGGGGSDASQLAAWGAAANAATAPVSAAMAQEGAQYAAEAGPITKALQAYGQANAEEVNTAPEATWLQALASHVTSNLSYYGSIPTADTGVLEQAPGVAEALQQAGGYGGQTGTGLTPLQDIQVQNGKVSVAKNPSTSPGSVSQGTVAPAGVSAGS
jgi:hypothetical protein